MGVCFICDCISHVIKLKIKIISGRGLLKMTGHRHQNLKEMWHLTPQLAQSPKWTFEFTGLGTEDLCSSYIHEDPPPPFFSPYWYNFTRSNPAYFDRKHKSGLYFRASWGVRCHISFKFWCRCPVIFKSPLPEIILIFSLMTWDIQYM
jgi:hypothetical protein